jgi:anti-repressor protein
MEQKKQVVPFDFQGNRVRTVVVEDEPMFVAVDVATALGYRDTINAIKQHCRGVAKHHPLLTTRGTQTVRVIGEPDLYRMIMGSRLSEADKLEDWVVGEVLPTIRKTGVAYLTAEKAAKSLVIPVDLRFTLM